jgi:acyl-homoserine-lactone acylase
LLASSESDDPASPHYADGTREYASKHWMRVPFSEEAIAHDPALVTQVLTAPAADRAAAR